MKLGMREFLQFFYWRLRRNRSDAAHMLMLVPGLARNVAVLLCLNRWSRVRRPTVAIALMEHMGDIVAAEPIARLARKRFPGARIFWITRAPYAVLPEHYPEVDHVVVVRCLTEWMLLQRVRLFDVVWDLHADARMCPQCSIPQIKAGAVAN